MLRLLQQLRDRIWGFWTSATPAARVTYTMATIAVLAIVSGVGYWSSQPQYVNLVQGLPPTEVAKIVSQLETQNIAYRLDFSGSSVLVAKHQYSQARVAAGEHLGPLGDERDGLVEGSFIADPSLNQHRLMQAKERELERTLTRIKSVTSADVHIAQPIPSPFARERKPATASIVLQLRPDHHLARHQAAAMAAMVAGAVEGLTPDLVTITDVYGNMLWSEQMQGGGQVMERVEYQRNIEQKLATNAESMLEFTLGEGKAVVRVAADIDFNSREMHETTYDPQAKVKKSEKTRTTNKTTAARGNAAGVVGVTGNQAGSGATVASAAPVSEKQEEFETEYQNPVIESTVTEMPGTIKRLTIAAMVDLSGSPPADGADPNAGDTTPVVTKEQVERIIKNAVGFSIERSDQIEVVVTRLQGPAESPLDAVVPWEFYALIARNASLGIASLVALTLGVMVIRTFAAAVNRMPERTAGGKSETIRELASQAQRNPEVVSKILAAWLTRTSEGEGGQATVPFDGTSRGSGQKAA